MYDILTNIMDCSNVLLIIYQSLRRVAGCVQRNTSIWDDPAFYDKCPSAIWTICFPILTFCL